jgi:hypothetical protein
MRLAGDPGLAAQVRIEIREGAGAWHQTVATLDHAVGIGTDEWQLARLETLKQGPVVLGLLGFVIKQAGAQNGLGSIWIDKFDVEPVDQRHVALRPEKIDLFRAFGDQLARHIARCDNVVPAVRIDPDGFELPDHPCLPAAANW